MFGETRPHIMAVNQRNQIAVGGSVVGSQITINQSGGSGGPPNGGPDCIKYVPDPASCREYGPAGPVPRKAWIAFAFAFLGAISPVIGAVADLADLFSYLEIRQSSTTYGILAFVGLCTLLAVRWGHDDRRVAQANKETNPPPKPGTLYRDLGNSRVLAYTLFAACSYPGCNGKVIIVDAPEREKGQHDYVGWCLIGAKRHTYTVDPNFIGMPREFDWRKNQSPSCQ